MYISMSPTKSKKLLFSSNDLISKFSQNDYMD